MTTLTKAPASKMVAQRVFFILLILTLHAEVFVELFFVGMKLCDQEVASHHHHRESVSEESCLSHVTTRRRVENLS